MSYYYTKDHLGSVREMTDGSGAIVARYDYDSYGKVTKVSGSMDANFQFAGYYEHATSGLNPTWFRAYDPISAKWLSRDKMGEGADMTLYSYVANNPTWSVDPMGLDDVNFLQNYKDPASVDISRAASTYVDKDNEFSIVTHCYDPAAKTVLGPNGKPWTVQDLENFLKILNRDISRDSPLFFIFVTLESLKMVVHLWLSS